MNSSLQLFSPADSFIDGRLEAFLNTGAARAIALAAPPLRAALVLYVLLYGVAILRGAISEPVVDFAVRSLKLAFIYMLATTVAYGDWVATPLFHTLPQALTTAISGQASANVGAAFDQFFARAAYLGEKIGQAGGFGNLPAALLSAAVVVIAALAAALGFGVSLVAKLALALLVALGPIFIACALFDASRRFFFGWLGQAVNYLVLMALIVTVLQLVLGFVADQWSQIDAADPMTGGVMFIALCLVAAVLFLHLPALASGIAGGASAGVSDFAGAAGLAWRGARGRAPSPGARDAAPSGGGRLAPAASGR